MEAPVHRRRAGCLDEHDPAHAADSMHDARSVPRLLVLQASRGASVILIELTQGKVAVVDNEDADLALVNWCARKASKTFYAYRQVRDESGKLTLLALHQAVARRLGFTGIADHRDRDGLNCRRGNLRPATQSQNAANRTGRQGTSSGLKGVTWDRRAGKWAASIMVNYKRRYLGRHVDKTEAAKAYDAAAREEFGEFAVVNFP